MRVRILFTGLCNFVPVYRDPARTNLEKVWVLLVNATQPETIPGGGHRDDTGRRIIDAHHACACFPLKYIRPDLQTDASVIWRLENSDLHLLDENRQPLGENALTLSPPDNIVPNGPDDSPDAFAWIASSGEGEARHASVHADCLSADPTQVPPDRVSARLQIFRGRISTLTRVRRAPPAQAVRFQFPPAQPRRPLAEEVVLDLGDLSSSRVILEKVERSSGEVQSLTLEPVDDELSISIMNLEPSAIMGVDIRDVPTEIEEFRWFYKLSASPAAPFPRPTTDAAHGGNPFCPLARSEPVAPTIDN